MLHRSIGYLKTWIIGYKDITKEKEDKEWLKTFRRLRIICTDTERNELEETNAWWDFTRSLAVGVLLLALLYTTWIYSTSNKDFKWIDSIVLVGFGIFLFILARLQQEKSYNPLLEELLQKYGLKRLEWISNIYLFFLGRGPDKTEEQRVKERLLEGDCFDSIIQDILASDEFAKSNASDYCNHYLEDNSATCIGKYAQEIKQKSLQDVIIELCTSNEFQGRYSTQTRSYIKRLYEKILGREPTVAELVDYSNNLAIPDDDKKAIITKLTRTEEFAKRRLDAYYKNLQIEPLDIDLDRWIVMIKNGTSLQEIMKRIVVREIYSRL